MHNNHHKTSLAAAVALACGSLSLSPAALAQEESEDQAIEEIVSVGRLKSGAAALVDERMEVPFSADYLSFEAISRAGDADIAAALRRVPGLTVVDGKFVYVRGLGERYSSVQVNGAAVPSPELTRSVIPLDLFPTSIVESIKIQKSPSPDQPASFGGGSIDIRTKSVPDDFIASINISGGFNSEGDSAGLQFNRSSDRLPAAIAAAIPAYQGDISVGNILDTLELAGPATRAQAEAINQDLINSLNSDIGSSYQSNDPDFGAKASLGNSFYFGADEEFRLGALVDFSYNERWRNDNQRREAIGSPENQFVDIDRTVYEERTVASLNLGFDYLSDHQLTAAYYNLQNDEAQADFTRGFDANNELIDGDQKLLYGTRFEQRELELYQVAGTHTFYETPYLSGIAEKLNLTDLEFDWFWSDSTANTELPFTEFAGNRFLDGNGNVIAGTTQISATAAAGLYSFLELDDDMTSWGGNFRLPVELGNANVTLSSGWWGSKKVRDYVGYNVSLDAVGVPASVLAGTPADVLQPSRLTVDNGFEASLRSNFGTESYIAAQKVDAFYAMFDAEWTKWRWSFGGRFEDYQQVTVPFDYTDFSGGLIADQINQLNSPDQRLAIREDDTYLSTALTYMDSGLLGADDYQFRFSYGQTVVRPDLRELAAAVYIDPELRVRIAGNPNLLTSPIDNLEARGEFYYANGDNFTVSVFYKDIQNPIEQIRTAGSDDNIQLTFTNAESGEVYGVELEGLKTLGNTGLFLSGNLTLSDSELNIDTTGITGAPTNSTRRLTGHSEYVVNATLGWDADSGLHSAFLNYNVFGERIFYGGISGNQDAFQEPFHSLGIVYKWFPTDYFELNVSVDNILDDNLEFRQVNLNDQEAILIDQVVGRTFGVTAKLNF